MELKSKLDIPSGDYAGALADGADASTPHRTHSDVRAALESLGYGPEEIHAVLIDMPTEGDTSRLLKDALRRLASGIEQMREELLNESESEADLLSPSETETDTELLAEPGLRPRTLAEFVGQAELKSHLRVILGAASKRRDAVDHLLFAGPPGLGKTTFGAHNCCRDGVASVGHFRPGVGTIR